MTRAEQIEKAARALLGARPNPANLTAAEAEASSVLRAALALPAPSLVGDERERREKMLAAEVRSSTIIEIACAFDTLASVTGKPGRYVEAAARVRQHAQVACSHEQVFRDVDRTHAVHPRRSETRDASGGVAERERAIALLRDRAAQERARAKEAISAGAYPTAALARNATVLDDAAAALAALPPSQPVDASETGWEKLAEQRNAAHAIIDAVRTRLGIECMSYPRSADEIIAAIDRLHPRGDAARASGDVERAEREVAEAEEALRDAVAERAVAFRGRDHDERRAASEVVGRAENRLNRARGALVVLASPPLPADETGGDER